MLGGKVLLSHDFLFLFLIHQIDWNCLDNLFLLFVSPIVIIIIITIHHSLWKSLESKCKLLSEDENTVLDKVPFCYQGRFIY